MPDLVARLDRESGQVTIGSPDAAPIPDPLYAHLRRLGGIYRPGNPRELWWRTQREGAATVRTLQSRGYEVETVDAGIDGSGSTAPRLRECGVCGQPYRWTHVQHPGEVCKACGKVLDLIPAPGR